MMACSCLLFQLCAGTRLIISAALDSLPSLQTRLARWPSAAQQPQWQPGGCGRPSLCGDYRVKGARDLGDVMAAAKGFSV